MSCKSFQKNRIPPSGCQPGTTEGAKPSQEFVAGVAWSVKDRSGPRMAEMVLSSFSLDFNTLNKYAKNMIIDPYFARFHYWSDIS